MPDPHLFDQDFPEGEQFPRQMTMLLTENINPDAVDPRSVTMTVNGARVGDPLTDNNYRDDGYRFHDVFHLAHAAILGWSPILRALMKRKRRSNPELSRREDGRPSMIAEEGIVAMLFSYAERRNFLKSETQIEPLVMGLIQDMTSKLEVRARTTEDWEEAIFTAYSHWRNIRAWGQGRLEADLNNRTLDLYLPNPTVGIGQASNSRPG